MFIYNFLRGFFTVKVLKIALKMHKIAPFLKNFLGGIPPNPPSKDSRHAALRHMYIQNPRNFKVGPPLKNLAYAPGQSVELMENMSNVVVSICFSNYTSCRVLG